MLLIFVDIAIVNHTDIAMVWVHPWVGLGWVGSEIFAYEMGWV